MKWDKQTFPGEARWYASDGEKHDFSIRVFDDPSRPCEAYAEWGYLGIFDTLQEAQDYCGVVMRGELNPSS